MRDGGSAFVVNLNVGRVIKKLEMTGLPNLGGSASWLRHDRRVLAVPHVAARAIGIIDMTTWATVDRIEQGGAGLFMRSHDAARYVWTAGVPTAGGNALVALDKSTLATAKTVALAAGERVAHVEFDRTGRHALVCILGSGGVIVIYDMETLAEIKRVQISTPFGAFNVANQVRMPEGRSR